MSDQPPSNDPKPKAQAKGGGADAPAPVAQAGDQAAATAAEQARSAPSQDELGNLRQRLVNKFRGKSYGRRR